MSVSEIAVPPVEPRAGVRKLAPAGIQPTNQLIRRRLSFAAFNLSVYAGLLWVLAQVLGSDGWQAADVIFFLAFAVASPWTVLGFGKAVVGFWLLYLVKDPMAKAAPHASAGDEATPITIDTAAVMTIRNEDPARALLRLRTLKGTLDRTGYGEHFSYFIMSDSDESGTIAEEEAAVAKWKSELPHAEADRIVYRRREVNSGFKAGNIRDFCEGWGADYELMLTLDVDSLMSGETVVRLVRMMQAHPKIGILQSLVTGMPSSSAFARIFQFGMRHGMRTYTMGQAWWTGDCSPYWGHNALVRIKPFLDHCELPVLPGEPPLGGHILSHDQVEAAFMRRSGYEVRVLPEECGSWEENPPTVLEFIRRDLRWCQGNLQYLKVLRQPGLHVISRFQLIWAVIMFLSIPAWPLMIVLSPVIASNSKAAAEYPTVLASVLYITFLFMHASPKLAGFLEVLAKGGAGRYGGPARFAASAVIEIVFSFLLAAISAIRVSIFIAGLAFGRTTRWNGQSRDVHGIGWAAAASAMWPQTAVGAAVCGSLYLISPKLLLFSLPLTAGCLLAGPFTIVTASPWAGRLLQKTGLCGVPEDFCPAREVEEVRAGLHMSIRPEAIKQMEQTAVT
jgi:membrane glycosyltransferase